MTLESALIAQAIEKREDDVERLAHKYSQDMHACDCSCCTDAFKAGYQSAQSHYKNSPCQCDWCTGKNESYLLKEKNELMIMVSNQRKKIAALEKRVERLRCIVKWVKDQCGYASKWWIKMNEALKQDDNRPDGQKEEV